MIKFHKAQHDKFFLTVQTAVYLILPCLLAAMKGLQVCHPDHRPPKREILPFQPHKAIGELHQHAKTLF